VLRNVLCVGCFGVSSQRLRFLNGANERKVVSLTYSPMVSEALDCFCPTVHALVIEGKQMFPLLALHDQSISSPGMRSSVGIFGIPPASA